MKHISRNVAMVASCLAAICACTGNGSADDTPEPSPSTSDPGGATTQPESLANSPSSAPRPTVTVSPRPVAFDRGRAREIVEHLAGQIGPREAASAAYDQAAGYVSDQFEQLGYRVSTTTVPVPAGDSWGVPVDAGESSNVMADSAGFDLAEPHIVIGAHLDTVAAAPGAEDNASGVAVMMELARMASVQPPGLPVRFIAFGAEEPRGDGDDMHHFGSQQYVAELTSAQRDAVVAMVSLDRVGVSAEQVPVCTGGTGTVDVRDALIDAAGRVDVPVQSCDNRSSDHWSFEKADIPSARIGSVPYAAYHSADDVPDVVSAEQLQRVGRIAWEWLSAFEGR